MFPQDHFRAQSLWNKNEDYGTLYAMAPGLKERSRSEGPCTNFTVCLWSKKIVFQDFVGEEFVVEEPWTSVLSELPKELDRRVCRT